MLTQDEQLAIVVTAPPFCYKCLCIFVLCFPFFNHALFICYSNFLVSPVICVHVLGNHTVFSVQFEINLHK